MGIKLYMWMGSRVGKGGMKRKRGRRRECRGDPSTRTIRRVVWAWSKRLKRCGIRGPGGTCSEGESSGPALKVSLTLLVASLSRHISTRSMVCPAAYHRETRLTLRSGVTSWQYLSYATSTVLKVSLSGTISTAAAIIIAVGKPFMAKLADVFGRGETYIVVTICYCVGYTLIATANGIEQIATGNIIYSFGYTGLQIMSQIIMADMTTLRWRGLSTALLSLPFIINNFVSAEITEAILPNWRWGYGMVSPGHLMCYVLVT